MVIYCNIVIGFGIHTKLLQLLKYVSYWEWSKRWRFFNITAS